MSGEGVVASFREGLALADELADPRLRIDLNHEAIRRTISAMEAQIAGRLRALPAGWRVGVGPPQLAQQIGECKVTWQVRAIPPDSPIPAGFTIYGPLPEITPLQGLPVQG